MVRAGFQDEQVLFFTEYKATQALVMSALQQRFGKGCVTFINGDERIEGVVDLDGTVRTLSLPRVRAAQDFNAGNVRFLVSTEAAGEGIDLQERCAALIHIDLPWNPMRLHQRVGRLSRYGQTLPVRAITLCNPDTVEARIWDKLNEKIARIQRALSSVMEEPEDVLQLVLGMTSPGLFDELFGNAGAVPRERLSEWFDQRTTTFGGKEVIDTVKSIVGNVRRFDFQQVTEQLPKVDLADLRPFLTNMLHLSRRRVEADGDTISFKTPDEWRRADFALLPEYRDVVFDRSVRGPNAASRVMGAGHRLFDRALAEAQSLSGQVARVPGLDAPLIVFSVLDRITGRGSQMPRVVVGVLDGSGTEPMVLRDWELLRRLNTIEVRARGREAGSSDFLDPDLLGRLDELEPQVLDRARHLGIDLRLPEAEPVALLLPRP